MDLETYIYHALRSMFSLAERFRNVVLTLMDCSTYFIASSQFLSAAKVFAACSGKTSFVGFAAISASVLARQTAFTSFTSTVNGTLTFSHRRFTVAVFGVTGSKV